MRFLLIFLISTGAHAGAFCGFGTDTCGQGPDQWDIQRMQIEQRSRENMERQRQESYYARPPIQINSIRLKDGSQVDCTTFNYGDSPFSSTECR